MKTVLCILLGAAILVRLVTRRQIRIDRQEYLDFLDLYQWTSGPDLQLAIERYYGGWIDRDEFYRNLDRLVADGEIDEREGVVEIAQVLEDHYVEEAVTEYKLTWSGSRKRPRKRKKEKKKLRELPPHCVPLPTS